MTTRPKIRSSQDRRRARRAAHRTEQLAANIAREHSITLEEARERVIAAAAVGSVDQEALEAYARDPRYLLRQARAALQQTTTCGNCGHDFSDHVGTDGPCTYEDGRGACSCGAYEEVDDDLAAAAVTFSFSLTPEMVDDAVAAVSARYAAGGNAIPDSVLEAVRARFAEVTLDAPVGEVLPERNPSPPAPEVQQTRDGQLRWTMYAVPEGRLTDDGRAMAPGALSWRELPLTLMAMIETTPQGHEGALVSGRIDEFWREANFIKASGVFDAGEYGQEIGRLVGEGTLRGVSVDIAVHEYEVGPRSDYFDDDGNWAPREQAAQSDDEGEADLLDMLFGEPEDVVFVVTKGVIGAVTVCPFPAFADARIELAASLVSSATPAVWTVTSQAGASVVYGPNVGEATGEPLEGVEVPLGEDAVLSVTASGAGLAPEVPPAEWFADPQLSQLTPLTVTDDGRVFGHAWEWGTCHIGIPDVCTSPPTSDTQYAYFLLKEVACADGGRVACGTITLDTDHADRRLGRVQATSHYDHTGTAVADVAFGEDDHGGWFAGALRPDVDAEKARKLRGAVLSGDWRNVNGNLELVALLAVNVPGFPVPRARALVAAAEDGASEVLALVAAGINLPPTEADSLERIKALGARDAFADLADRAERGAAA